MKEPNHLPRVVIVGAGFGGLWALRRCSQLPVEVILIDRHNYHTFLPLLYQVAAAELEPEEIVYPVRSILRRFANAQFVMAEVLAVDLAARILRTSNQDIPFEFLILAVGSTTHFFGVPGAADHAFPLKTIEDGVALRNHILKGFERAVIEPDRACRRAQLTFVIVGGGPTGVEFGGALAELIRGPLRKDYPTLDFDEVRVVLLEAKDTLLPGWPQRLSTYAAHRLRRMGLEVRLSATVREVSAQMVRLDNGLWIPAETVVWTAGVRGSPRVTEWGLPTTRSGRVVVAPTLQVSGHPKVYVVGDLAEIEGDPSPMIAPAATQQGEAAARNIGRQLRGAAPLSFRYRDRGTMATIGRNAAVAHLGRLVFTGFPAWVLWLSVHLANLIGFRNRLIVLINWAWDYLAAERAVRLILPNGAEQPRV